MVKVRFLVLALITCLTIAVPALTQETSLHELIISWDTKGGKQKLQDAIQKTKDINAVNLNGYTALHLAITNAPLEAVNILLENGADPNVQNALGNTPLHLAALYGYFRRTMKSLFEHGAEPDLRNSYGYTALHLAILNAPPSTAYALLENGADPNVRNAQGNTPFHLTGRRRMMKPLFEHGADPNIRNLEYQTPLHKALNECYHHAVAHLLEYGADPNAVIQLDDEYFLPLKIAEDLKNCSPRRKSLIRKYLAEYGGRFEYVAVAIAAVFHNDENVASGFVGSAGTGKTPDRAESDALERALGKCNSKMQFGLSGECKSLFSFVEQSLNPDTGSITDIFLAVSKAGDVESVGIIGSHNTAESKNKSTTDITSNSAGGAVEVSVNPLVFKGSASYTRQWGTTDIQGTQSSSGRGTVLNLNYTGYNLGINANILHRAFNKDPSDPPNSSGTAEYLNLRTQIGAIRDCGNNGGENCEIEVLVTSKELFNQIQKKSNGQFFVDVVSHDFALEDIYLLLLHGYKPWEISSGAWSAIHEAAIRGNLPALRAMLGSIPDTNLQKILRRSDELGNSPLHVALLRSNHKSQLAVVEELLVHNAPVSARNSNALLPLHLAILRGESEVVRRILDIEGSLLSDYDLRHAISMALGLEENESIIEIFQELVDSSFMNDVVKKIKSSDCRKSKAKGHDIAWWETDCGAVEFSYQVPAKYRNYPLPFID